jgi:hypothetical protein
VRDQADSLQFSMWYMTANTKRCPGNTEYIIYGNVFRLLKDASLSLYGLLRVFTFSRIFTFSFSFSFF